MTDAAVKDVKLLLTTDLLRFGSYDELEACLLAGGNPDKLWQGKKHIECEIDENGIWKANEKEGYGCLLFPGSAIAFLQHLWHQHDPITGQQKGKAGSKIGRMMSLLLEYGACVDNPLICKVKAGLFSKTTESATMTPLTMAVLQLAIDDNGGFPTHNAVFRGENALLLFLIRMYLNLGADLGKLMQQTWANACLPQKLQRIIYTTVRLLRVYAIVKNHDTDRETLEPKVYDLKYLTPLAAQFTVHFDRLLQEVDPREIWAYLNKYVARESTYVLSPHRTFCGPCEIDCTEALTKLRFAHPWSKHSPSEFPPAFRGPLLIVLAFAKQADHWLGEMLSSSVNRPITILDYVADWLPLDHFPLCAGRKRKHNEQLAAEKRQHNKQKSRELQLAWHSNPHV